MKEFQNYLKVNIKHTTTYLKTHIFLLFIRSFEKKIIIANYDVLIVAVRNLNSTRADLCLS